MTATDAQTEHRIAFVCVQNAGRSQMAAAFAERECARRDADNQIDVITGGTDPADRVHDRSRNYRSRYRNAAWGFIESS